MSYVLQCVRRVRVVKRIRYALHDAYYWVLPSEPRALLGHGILNRKVVGPFPVRHEIILLEDSLLTDQDPKSPNHVYLIRDGVSRVLQNVPRIGVQKRAYVVLRDKLPAIVASRDSRRAALSRIEVRK